MTTDTEALPPLPEALTELMRHVRRLMAHVDDWQRWYGSADVLLRHQLPLAPAGTVRVMEDLSEAIDRASAALAQRQQAPEHCPACGYELAVTKRAATPTTEQGEMT